MRPDALQARPSAGGRRQDQIEVEELEHLGYMLGGHRRGVDFAVMAVHTIPPCLRPMNMLRFATLHFADNESVNLDITWLPRPCTLRIADSNTYSLWITGTEMLQVPPRAARSLEVACSETLQEIQLDATTFSRLSVHDLPQLRTLDVSDSRLQHIVVSRAPRLERFDASMNPLPGGDLELDDVAGLTTVSLARAQLSDIPAALREMPALRTLDMRGNRLSIVSPHALPPALLSLDLSENSLVAAPLDSAFQATLRELKLGMNRIRGLSDIIGTFRRIEVLDLSHNCLSELPHSIGQCSLLRVLKLSSNRLICLPEEICDLASLEILDVDANMLVILPADMHRLTRLDSLEVQHNMLNGLPDRLDEVRLRRLNLRGNPFFEVPHVLLRNWTLAGHCAFEYLTELDLGNLRLVEVPQGLGYRCALVQLRLSGNEQLSTLHGDFAHLRQLRWLDLRGCGFRQLPAVFKEMSIRTDVLLHRNPLDQQVRLELQAFGFASEGGARILPEQPRAVPSISDEVRWWRALSYGEMTPKAEACWSARVPFRRSHAFARLMAGLRESLEFQAASVAGRTRFVFAVNRLLTVVENHPELVDEVLESAGMNASTIADRYRQSFDRLMLAAQLHMMGKGAGTEELVAATLMRDSYRRERVATMAAQQAREQRVDAEVALDLAYRLHLSRGAVGFPFDYDVELAEIAAHLDDAYFAELAEDIRSAETRELVDFMISSSVWRRFLIRMHYTRYLGLIDRFDVNLDPGSADGRHSDPGAASPQDLAFDMARARRDRDIRVAQREAAVRDWLQLETIALLHDNPVMHGASPEPS